MYPGARTGDNLDYVLLDLGPEYKAAIAQEQINLRTAFTNAAARFNNAGESVFAGTAFALADLPIA